MSKGQLLQSFFFFFMKLPLYCSRFKYVGSSIQLDEAFIDVNLSVLVNIQSKKKEVLNLVERGHAFLDVLISGREKKDNWVSKLLRLGEIKKEKKCMSSNHDYPPSAFIVS